MNIFEAIRKNKLLDSVTTTLSNFIFILIRILSKRSRVSENKILIISLHKIGDSIFTLPAMKALVQNYDSNKINLLVYEEVKIIFEDQIKVRNIFTLDKNNLLFQNRLINRSSRKLIKKINPDTIIDLTGSILTASLIFNTAAKKIYGMNEKYFKYIYSDFIPVRHVPHLIDRYCDVAELVIKKKIDRSEFEYNISFNKNDKILIHPFAGWKAKEWGLKRYITLAEKLCANFNVALIFPVNSVSDEMLNYLSENKIHYIETNSLENLKSEIVNSSLLIGNDSGPIYMAALYSKPTFTIYGPTNPEYSKPFGKLHKQIKKNLKCSPVSEQYCYLLAGRNCPSNECMVLLDEDYIYEEVIKFINELGICSIN